MNLFAQNGEKNTVIYIGGDYSSVNYHLGVLSEIERLHIKVDSVVATDWGAFVGALWSAGWSAGQIGELVKSWDSLPRAKYIQNPALWKKDWIVKHKENGEPLLEAKGDSSVYFGQIFFDLRVQESLWRSDVGSVIPFTEIDKSNNYPFPPESRISNPESPNRLFSTPIALRDTNGTADQRHQQKLWNKDSTLIIFRPHSKPNSDSLFEAGIQAVQSKRSILAQINPESRIPNPSTHNFQPPPPPRFLYHPVFDSVPAEIQMHFESLWNPQDTGILAVRNFIEALQKDGSYRDLKLTLDTGSFLQVNANSNSQLSLSLFGFGGTLFGANIAADVNFHYINQFGYNLNLTAFYGQGAKGVVPEVRFERFFMDNGDFFAKLKFFEYEPISFFQRKINEEARLINENGWGMFLGVEKAALTVAVEIERREITSGASLYASDFEIVYDEENEREIDMIPLNFLYKPVYVNSMFPYAKWLWQSEGYDRWFASEGFMAELLGGFKTVSVQSFDNSAPLYVSTQGKLNITHALSDYVYISGGTEFGANFRRTDKGRMVLPAALHGTNYIFPIFEDDEETTDPALDNRYRFAMGMGSYLEEWQTPDNSSHRYGIISAGLSVQSEGNGIFVSGGYAKNGEPTPHSQLGAHRLFVEPKIRIKTQIFDFVLGRNLVYSINKAEKQKKNDIFMTIQGKNF